MIRRAILAAVCALPVGGCDRWSPGSACEDAKAWSNPTTSRSVGLAVAGDGLLVSLDAPDAETVLGDARFGPRRHGIALLDPASGAVRWSTELVADGLWHGAALSPAGLVFAGEVRFGCPMDHLYVHRLDEDDRSELWKVDLPGLRNGEGLLPIAALDDRVAVSSSTEVVMLDAADGAILWRRAVAADHLDLTASGQLVASQVFGSQVNLLDAVDGSIVWSHDAGTGVNALATTDDGEVTIAAGFKPFTIRRLASDGSVRWERELSGRWFSSLAALPGGDVLWMAGLEDRVDSVDGTTVEDGCGYIARLAAADGAVSDVRPMCDCAVDAVATSDATGRAFLGLPDTSSDGGSVSAFQ